MPRSAWRSTSHSVLIWNTRMPFDEERRGIAAREGPRSERKAGQIIPRTSIQTATPGR